jgi:hypothetical protein
MQVAGMVGGTEQTGRMRTGRRIVLRFDDSCRRQLSSATHPLSLLLKICLFLLPVESHKLFSSRALSYVLGIWVVARRVTTVLLNTYDIAQIPHASLDY